MRIELDFSTARRTASDDIVGVLARLGGQTRRVTITANAVVEEDRRDEGVQVGTPGVCSHQAWLAAVLVGGNTLTTPIGEGQWDEEGRTMSWPLRSGQRRIMA